jgi:4-hydroxyphenylpyruvate dioxygenase
MHYDGLRDRSKHAERIEEMKLWIEMAKILGTNLIAIPSTCLPDAEVSGDRDLIAQDLREVADLGRSDGILFAYEALCWGTHVNLWEDVWDIVQRVDRPNLGICLDTYNLVSPVSWFRRSSSILIYFVQAGRVYADPTSPDGKTSNADADMEATLQRLVQIVDVKKLFYVQVVDAQRLAEPLVEGHELYNPDQCARMSWSRNCRLFYGEEDRGAYLPIRDTLEAILVGLGFEGYISAELFNSSLTEEGVEVPAEHARRAAESWQKIVADFGLNVNTHAASTAATARLAVESAPRAQL